MIKQFDLSLLKRLAIVGRVNAEFRVDALNVFNNVNFVPVTGTSITSSRTGVASQAAFEVTQQVATTQARVVQIVSRVRW
jgi:hypothetical protein